MQFKKVIGHHEIKKRLINSVKESRISHAQLFYGAEGSHKLALAIAYAQYINCTNRTDEDSCGVCKSCRQIEKLQHPDIHFIYPTIATTDNKDPQSTDYISQWRDILFENDFHITTDKWYEKISQENKQGIIRNDDLSEIIKKVGSKSYESDYKILIIWMIEKLYYSAAPKLLKTLEEPPEKTLFLLITENYEKVLTTIISRTQLVKVPKYSTDLIRNTLIDNYQTDVSAAAQIARMADGNMAYALKLKNEGSNTEYFDNFSNFMRKSFTLIQQRKDYKSLYEIIQKLSAFGREQQKAFLYYCTNLIRQCLFLNQNLSELVIVDEKEMEFLKKFSPFIHQQNVENIYQEFNKAIFHIERNGSAKIIFTDLAIKIGIMLKKN